MYKYKISDIFEMTKFFFKLFLLIMSTLERRGNFF